LTDEGKFPLSALLEVVKGNCANFGIIHILCNFEKTRHDHVLETPIGVHFWILN
jgi:hypothetical protein